MSQTTAHFMTANQAMIVFTAESLGTAPQFTPTEANRRRELAINLTMAFLPTEPVQTMFASLVAGNYMSIMDGFRETNSTPSNLTQSGRARMVSVAQTRCVVGLVHELRVVRKEALAAAEAEWAARQPAAKTNEAPAREEATPRPAPAAETEASVVAKQAPAAPIDPEEAEFEATAAEFQASDAHTLETRAEGLAEGIPAALAERNQMPGTQTR